MKRLILVTVGLGLVIGLILSLKGPRAQATSVPAAEGKHDAGTRLETEQRVKAPTTVSDEGSGFEQLIEMFVSSKTSYEQKQLAWKRIEEAGEMDSAIAIRCRARHSLS